MKVELIDQDLVTSESLNLGSKYLEFSTTNPQSFEDCRQQINLNQYPREVLVSVLADYNCAIGNDDSADANISALTGRNACAVVTGQQAGLFTGPLYTIYKAITTIKLSRELSERFRVPVVPIFWNATEDHDLSEIAHCSMPGREWTADFGCTGMAGETLKTDPAVTVVIRDFLATISEEHRSEVEEFLSCSTDNYGVYSSSVLAGLFKGTGLIILEPRILRPLAAELFQRIVGSHDEIRNALSDTARELELDNIRPSFSPQSGFGLFHISKDGRRRQVLECDGGFVVNGTELSDAELNRDIGSAPQSYSTGAYLRPVLQSTVIPTLAYVAGPGEYIYHLQLRSLFHLFGATMPVLHLRNQATILGLPEQRLGERLSFNNDALFAQPQAFYQQLDLPTEESVVFEAAREKLEMTRRLLIERMESLVGERAIETYHKKALSELEKVRKRAEREYRRQHEVDNARINRFFDCVSPAGGRQERRINIFHFISQYGKLVMEDLFEILDPFESRHYILRIESPRKEHSS